MCRNLSAIWECSKLLETSVSASNYDRIQSRDNFGRPSSSILIDTRDTKCMYKTYVAEAIIKCLNDMYYRHDMHRQNQGCILQANYTGSSTSLTATSSDAILALETLQNYTELKTSNAQKG